MSRQDPSFASTGAWIRAGRQDRGWTQAELGKQLGASQPTISQWERDVGTPGQDLLARMERLFGRKAPEQGSLWPSEDASAPSPDAGRSGPRKGRRGQPPSGTAHNTGSSRKKASDSGPALGFEAKLWAAADALRNNMDAAEYKHVVLGPGSRRSAGRRSP